MSHKNRWNNELLADLSRLMKPDKPKNYHTAKMIKRNANVPARIIKQNVKMLIENKCGYPEEE